MTSNAILTVKYPEYSKTYEVQWYKTTITVDDDGGLAFELVEDILRDTDGDCLMPDMDVSLKRDASISCRVFLNDSIGLDLCPHRNLESFID